MLDFLFGGKRKIELIRELLEQRMQDLGLGDLDSRLKIKQMGNMQLMGTPEGAIVTIVETMIKMQRQGLLIWQALQVIENHRKSLGQDPWKFIQIADIGRRPPGEAGEAVPMYVRYRTHIEHPGLMSDEQFERAFVQAAQFLAQ